jgi:hypothetical protein
VANMIKSGVFVEQKVHQSFALDQDWDIILLPSKSENAHIAGQSYTYSYKWGWKWQTGI